MPAEDAFGDAPEAAPAREIEVDDGVGALKADFHGAGEVSVHDPTIALDQFIHGTRELFIWNGSPHCAPEGAVEVDHGQAEALAQGAREGGFSGAGAADYQDTIH